MTGKIYNFEFDTGLNLKKTSSSSKIMQEEMFHKMKEDCSIFAPPPIFLF